LSTIAVNTTADKLFQPTTARVGELRPNPLGRNLAPFVSLRDAINIANNSPGVDTIVLQDRTYKFDQIDNYWYGPNALPAVASDTTIQGNGATLDRTGGPNFRFFYVSGQQFGGLPTGSLTLLGLTLRGGVAHGGDSYRGGGGLGAGGAIFNQGSLVLDSV